MKVPFLDLRLQYQQIKDEVLPVVSKAMEDAAFIGGQQVDSLEAEFAEFCGAKHCIGLNSGTDALRFALMAAGVGPGDEVITVPNTFIATTEAISQVGADISFVDIDPKTCNIDVYQVADKINDKTKALLPVHLYGQPAQMGPILDIAKEHGLIVIEDACQAHGAICDGRKAGTLGIAGCFSFYPGKNLGAFGDAGAVITNDEDMATTMRMLRDHGQSKKYHHEIEGYNGRLDAIQAAVLRIKLRRLSKWTQARQRNAQHYNKMLADINEITLPTEMENVQSVYHLYVIHVDDRDGLQRHLDQHDISSGLHYPVPLHLQNAYKHLGFKEGDFPATEKSAAQLLSLPMYPELTTQQIEYVCEVIKKYYR